MNQGWKSMARIGSLAAAAMTLSLGGVAVSAQSPSAPPPLPASAAPAKPAAQNPAPRSAIQLSPSERQAIDAAQSRKEAPAKVEDALAPTAEDIKPRAADDNSTTRIEQKQVSNRVNEVIVTPAGQSRSYVMTNREGHQPLSTTQMGSGGLSVPMFFRFEFGKSPPPATNPPSPPAQSPSR